MKAKETVVLDAKSKPCELCAGTGVESRMLARFECRRCGGTGRVKGKQ